MKLPVYVFVKVTHFAHNRPTLILTVFNAFCVVVLSEYMENIALHIITKTNNNRARASDVHFQMMGGKFRKYPIFLYSQKLMGTLKTSCKMPT